MPWYYFVLPGLSFAITWLFIAAFLKSPFVQYFGDIPDGRKLHEAPVPRIGGMCIIVSFVIVLQIWYSFCAPFFAFLHQQLYYTILACVVIVFFIGFLDDSTFIKVRIRHKLLAEVLLAVTAIAAFHAQFGQITLFQDLNLPLWISDLIAVFWIVGIINALNIIDGVNGLAGGVSIIGFVAMAIIGHQIDSIRVVMLCLVLSGGIGGFLLHNMRPSRVFLGDTGSLFLGALLGIVSLHIMNLSQAAFNLPMFSLIIGLPILDVLVAMVRRYFRARDRRRPFMHRLHATVIPDNNHIHHRLISRGYSHLQTSFLLYAFSLMLSIGAFTMQFVGTGLKFALAAYLVFATGLVLNRLGFGGRFFRVVRRWKARLAPSIQPQDLAIGIIDTRGIIFHACRESNEPGLIFERVNLMNMPEFERHLAGLVVYNASQTPLSQDLALARAFTRESVRPVFVVTEKISSDIRLTGQDIIFCKKMPVRIRPFLVEIREAIRAGAPQPAHLTFTPGRQRTPVIKDLLSHEIAS